MIPLTRWHGIACLAALCMVACGRHQTSSARLDSAFAALARGDSKTARQLALEIPEHSPEWPDAQMVLGTLAAELKDSQTALRHFRAIPRNGSELSLAAARQAAKLHHSRGQLHDAIGCLNYVLSRMPGDREVKSALANLYAQTGQRRLADRSFEDLLKAGQLTPKQLVLFTDFDRRDPKDLELLRRFESSAPQDPAVQLGIAADEFASGQLAAARERLERVVQADPSLSPAQGMLGELLVDDGDTSVERWFEALPESIRNDAEIWFVRGLHARLREQYEFAARCFWEAARQTPTSHRVLHQFGLEMSRIDPAAGHTILERAQTIYDMRYALSQALNSEGRDEAALRQVIDILLQSGREWEAWNWASFAAGLHPQAAWIGDVRRRLARYPKVDAPRIIDTQNIARRFDLSTFRAPDDVQVMPSMGPASPPGNVGIRFIDESQERGLDFIYYHGEPAHANGVRMQESTGGGVAVVDFDGDGLPDLFFTQGEEWPYESDMPSPSPQYRDRLYRNVGGRFTDVTEFAGIPPEDGFGQGCSAGDFNNDGFPDLYIANIGINQLLINNGDGTFTDASARLPLTHKAWTSSCVIADLNADGNPDLFDVNYLEGELLYRKICDEQTCTPQSYHSARDALFLSTGDGGVRPFPFDEETRWGAGLGVVAFTADLTDDASQPGDDTPESVRRLSLFVANDHEPNFFLVASPAENDENLSLRDEAFVRGLALNKDGRPTACMGVAAGDMDGDGRLDLFVTNYKREAKNLYLQDKHANFIDAITGTGLMAPGMPYVGWGTQCLDANNDGWLDLAVANGHVGNFRKADIECYMHPQFFHNMGSSRFQELTPETVGPYFARKLLGRALATLDWNRDGRRDFVVSNIADRAALLTNQSTKVGHHLTVRLHARTTARDALGTVVEVSADGRSWRQQLVGGDGYQATNEQKMHFGLGERSAIRRLVVHWPGGTQSVFTDVPIDCTISIVEGRAMFVVIDAP